MAKALLIATLLFASAIACASDSLTLLTYNIHSGIPFGKTSANHAATAEDMRAIADAVTSSGADIVALQEVRCDWKYGASADCGFVTPDMPRLLAKHCALRFVFASTLDDEAGFPGNTKYMQWGAFDQWTNNNATHGEFGNAILTRFPIDDARESIPLPRSGKEEQRGCLRLRIPAVPGFGDVIVYATHLEHTSADARIAQLKAILARAVPDSASATIFIMGDMNWFPQPGDEQFMTAARESGFHDLAEAHARTRDRQPDLTFPADVPNRRIDYILCSKPLQTEQATTLQTQASDHLPLMVRVRAVARD